MTIDDLRAIIAALVPAHRVQVGTWTAGTNAADRFVVIRPVGGPRENSIRIALYTVAVIGAIGEPVLTCAAVAETIAKAMQQGQKSGDIVSTYAGEPSYLQTADGRPVFEIAVEVTASS